MDFSEILIVASAALLIAALIGRHLDLARRERQNQRDY